MLKCSRCRHIFPADRTQREAASEDEQEPAEAPEPPHTPPSPPPVANDDPPRSDLDLNFEEAPAWEGEQERLPSFNEEDDYSLGTSTDSDARSARKRGLHETRPEPRLLSPDLPFEDADGVKTLGIATRRSDEATFSFDEAELDDTRSRRAGAARVADEGDEEEDAEDADDETSDEEEVASPGEDDVKRGRRWLVPLGLFFSIVVGVYFFLAQELIRDREFAEEFIARLPMVGGSLAADRLLFRKVALNDVEGGFVRVKQGKEVFVISGTAQNTASRPLRNIRVEASLDNGAGVPLQQEAITCGGMDARRLLQGLSLREVEMLGKVEPSRKFRLDPGDSTTFAIVFTSPPAAAADFSVRVASAQR